MGFCRWLWDCDTRLVNQARGLRREQDVVVPREINRIRRTLSEIAKSQSGGIGALFLELLRNIWEELAEPALGFAEFD